MRTRQLIFYIFSPLTGIHSYVNPLKLPTVTIVERAADTLVPYPVCITVGAGQVIRGWDKGLQDMCEGEKRKLQIPPQDGE